jgi:hypothetical protein
VECKRAHLVGAYELWEVLRQAMIYGVHPLHVKAPVGRVKEPCAAGITRLRDFSKAWWNFMSTVTFTYMLVPGPTWTEGVLCMAASICVHPRECQSLGLLLSWSGRQWEAGGQARAQL